MRPDRTAPKNPPTPEHEDRQDASPWAPAPPVSGATSYTSRARDGQGRHAAPPRYPASRARVVSRGASHGGSREQRFTYLDATHTPSEQKVYSVLYRESRRPDAPDHSVRMGVSELIERTGLSDKTVRNCIHTLCDKLSIDVTDGSQGIYARKYRVYDPRTIIRARQSAGIVLDRTTKKIVARGSTAVSTAASITPVTAVGPTAVGAPIKDKNIINNQQIKSSNNTGDDETSHFSHADHIRALYTRYTANPWTHSDERFYAKIRHVLADVIEAAIIASVLRCPGTVGSLAYCEGGIEEFAESLPMGYVSYLRAKWREGGGSGVADAGNHAEHREV